MTDESDDQLAESEVSIRRAPRLARFLILGAGLGAVVAFVLTALAPPEKDAGFGTVFGFLLVIAVPVGIAIGAGVAVLLDRRSSRRATTVIAGKIEVQTQHDAQDSAAPASETQLESGSDQPESDETPR
jgi:uncharacterized membrane protein YbhN (UPF0104 family)